MFAFLQSPRQTIRSVIDGGSLQGALILLGAYGLLKAFGKVITDLQIVYLFRQEAPWGPLNIGYRLLHAGIFDIGAVVLLAAFLYLTGRRMGGKASFRGIFVATTWPLLLSIIADTIGTTLAIAIAVGLGHLLSKDPLEFLRWSLRGIIWPLMAWQWVVTTLCLAEVEGFSMGKAFLNLILGCAVTAIVYFLIVNTLSIAAR